MEGTGLWWGFLFGWSLGRWPLVNAGHCLNLSKHTYHRELGVYLEKYSDSCAHLPRPLSLQCASMQTSVSSTQLSTSARWPWRKPSKCV